MKKFIDGTIRVLETVRGVTRIVSALMAGIEAFTNELKKTELPSSEDKEKKV